jgi:hypothetical protein
LRKEKKENQVREEPSSILFVATAFSLLRGAVAAAAGEGLERAA